eukprot:15461848-Alexandrium_andersonii.AAC.1
MRARGIECQGAAPRARAHKQANHPRPEEFRLPCGLVRSYPAPAAGCWRVCYCCAMQVCQAD